MSETPEIKINEVETKRGRGRPKKGETVEKPVKKALGRPKVHAEGARAFRDSKHRTFIDRERLKELLEIEQKYLMIKNI